MARKDHVAVRVLYLPGETGECACMSGAGLSSPEAIRELLRKCSELKETMAAANPGKTSLEVVDLGLQPAEKLVVRHRFLFSSRVFGKLWRVLKSHVQNPGPCREKWTRLTSIVTKGDDVIEFKIKIPQGGNMFGGLAGYVDPGFRHCLDCSRIDSLGLNPC